MKKLLVLFLSLLLTPFAADNAAACSSCSTRNRHHYSQNEGYAISVGTEFGVDNINDGDHREPYIGLNFMYDEALLNGKLNINIGFGYVFEFVKEFNADYKKVFPQTLTLDAGLGYNLNLRDTSTLSFLLESYTDFRLAPLNTPNDDNNVASVLSPGIRFIESLSFGDIYAQIGFPFRFAPYGVNTEFTIGWNSKFGLGLALDTYFHLSPEANWGRGLGTNVSYSFGRFSFFVQCLFNGIGVSGNSYYCEDCDEYHVDNGGVSINTIIGFKVSF